MLGFWVFYTLLTVVLVSWCFYTIKSARGIDGYAALIMVGAWGIGWLAASCIFLCRDLCGSCCSGYRIKIEKVE